MEINSTVTIMRGALHGIEGRLSAIHQSTQEVELEIDFQTIVITAINNVQTKTSDVSSEVQH
jgi:transcription antitermination factor NusG